MKKQVLVSFVIFALLTVDSGRFVKAEEVAAEKDASGSPPVGDASSLSSLDKNPLPEEDIDMSASND